MREFWPGRQGVSRGLRPKLLIVNKGASTSLPCLTVEQQQGKSQSANRKFPELGAKSSIKAHIKEKNT